MESLSVGNCWTRLLQTALYCSEEGYLVYCNIRVRSVCTISLRARADTTPVSIEVCTELLKEFRAGM